MAYPQQLASHDLWPLIRDLFPWVMTPQTSAGPVVSVRMNMEHKKLKKLNMLGGLQ